MIDNEDVQLAILNNNDYDLRQAAQFLYENDDWPNPYLHVNIDSKFFDIESFCNKFSNHPNPVFLSINIQSLLSKFDNLKNFVSHVLKHKVPLVCIAVQEVWQLLYSELCTYPAINLFTMLGNQEGGAVLAFILKMT
jgi:hypothetical protein